jgi:nucleotide-binding universal stress UspA family protein
VLENILIPLDGSDNSEQVVRWCMRLAHSFDSGIVLLAVIDPDEVVRPSSGPGRDRPIPNKGPLDGTSTVAETTEGMAYGVRSGNSSAESPPGFGTQAIEQVAQLRNTYVTDIASHLTPEGVKVRAMVTIGSPAEEIVRIADEQDIQLIAMATHRESALARGILGSVTDRVIHSAKIPVLAIRPVEISDTKSADIKVIVVPLDGSEISESVIPFATEIAIKTDSELIFARVTSAVLQSPAGEIGMGYALPSESITGENIAAEYLLPFVNDAKSRGISASMRTPIGRAASSITSLADENENTIIVIGTRGQGGIKRWVIGSVTDKVIRSSGHPVLVIPPELSRSY